MRIPPRVVRYGGAMFDENEIQRVMAQLQDPAGLVPGPRVHEFERRVADLMGKAHGVMVNSGSSALTVAMRLADLPLGSEVITPALTFSSDVAAIYQVGCTPVFVDVGLDDYQARVDQIRPQVGAMNRSLLVVADVINPGSWRPQATIEARIVVERRPDAIIVPLLSVVQRPAGQVVYVIDRGNGDTVRQQLVETGVRQDGWIEIRSGVEAGTPVVAEGAHYLSDGAAVNVAEEA